MEWLIVWTWSQTGWSVPPNWYLTLGNVLNSTNASVSSSIKHGNNTPHGGIARITCDYSGKPYHIV